MQLLIIILVLCIGSVFQASAAEIRVAFGVSLPPYVISSNNSGIEYDIIKESLAYKGHEIIPVYMPFIEVKDAIVEGRADAIATVKETIGVDGSYSDDVIHYHNFVISRKSDNIKINNIKDLSNKKVVAFQLATSYLGNEFAEMAKDNPFYREKTEQEKQVSLLLRGKVDVAVSDRKIFIFYKKNMDKKYKHIDVKYHNIFDANDYKVVFKEKKYRDDFNQGLSMVRSSGRYEEIIDSYIGI